MSKQKLTPWFPPDVKPVHHGVYQVRAPGDDENFDWSLFDGEWRCYCSTAENAAKEAGDTYVSYFAGEDEWRGLASNPKGKK